MSSITTSALDTPARRSVERTCDDLAVFVLAAVTLIAGLTFRDYGLGWDDYTHAEYADLLLRMFGSGFTDTAALSFANLYMYGGGFDMVAALLHKIIPLELFETRRLLGAVVGLIGLAVTWRLARRVGGPLAGLATLLLLALCPTFYGHMFMNPKDAPFAVSMVILMLGLVRLAEEYPQPSPRTVLIIGLGAGLSIGCRILGGLALVYAMVGFLPLLIEEVRTQGRAQGHPSLRSCRLRAAAGSRLGIPDHGAGVAVVDHEAGKSVAGADLFLAFLREALEGNVRRRAGVGSRHAVVVSADAVRAAASRSAAGVFWLPPSSSPSCRCRAPMCLPAARPFS